MLSEGEQIPKVSLASTDSRTVDLSKLDHAIVYFYPRDMTPGCTTEACGLRDSNADIEAAGWHVFGVSTDSIASHEKFIAKHALSFPLLSDPDHKAAEAFGVWDKKSMYGKIFFGTKRTTFAIVNGRVIRVWEKVKPAGHAAEVLDWIESRA